MKKRFIILLDEITEGKDKDDDFRKFAKSHNYGYWHWFPNSWLIDDSMGTSSASEIMDKVREIYGVNNFVVELGPDNDTWSGYGPKSEKSNMFEWLHKYWKK